MSETPLTPRALIDQADSTLPVGASRFAGRMFVICVVGWGLILTCEILERSGLIGQLTESVGRFAIWCVLSAALWVSAARWHLPRRPMVALSIFLVCTILGWAIGIAHDIPSLKGTPLFGRGGAMHHILQKVLFAGWALALGDLLYGLLRSVERQRESLSAAVDRLEREVHEHRSTAGNLSESKSLYSSLVESLDQCVFRKDAGGRVTFGNRKYCETLGHSLDELLGKKDADLFPAEFATKYRSDDHRVLETGSPLHRVQQFQRADGVKLDMEIVKTPVIDAAGNIVGIQGIFWDITEQHQGEKLIRQSERRLRTSLDATKTSCWEVNLKTGELASTRPSVEWMGYAPEEIPTNRDWWKSLTHPDDVDISRQALERHLAGHTATYECEYRVIGKSGQWFWTLDRGKIVEWDDHGEPVLIVGTDTDITQRKEAEQALLASEQRFRSVFEQAAVAVGVIESRSGRFVQINDKYSQLIGYSAEEITRKTWMEISHPDDIDANIQWRDGLIAGELHEFTMEKRLIRKDGSLIWINLTVSAIGTLEEPPTHHIVIVEDITQRKRADDSLRESEEQYRILLENHVDGVLVVVEENIQYVNDRMTSLCGHEREELLDHSFFEMLVPDDRSATEMRSQSRIPNGDEVASEFRLRHKDGRILNVEVLTRSIRYRGRPALLSVVRDVTRRKQLEEEARRHRDEMAHFNRINTMGEMATGLAHELNQPLTSIATYASIGATKALDQSRSPGNPEVATVLKKIQEQSLRAGEIIHRLQRFVKKERPEPIEFDINDAVRSAASLMSSECKRHGVTNRLGLMENPPTTSGSVVQIEQIILNLMRNATDAMREDQSPRRVLHVRTEQCGDHGILVEVSDTGPGVAPDDLESIFDAFVTTKADGMGLGLAISKSIAEAHRGTLTANLKNGQGMSFQLTLPSASRH